MITRFLRPRLTPAERYSRLMVGMAPRHPEWLTRDLPPGQEEWLAMAAEVAWPDDEYVAEILSAPAPAPAKRPVPDRRIVRYGIRRAQFTSAERAEFLTAFAIPGDQRTKEQRKLVCRFDEAVMR